MSLQHPGLSSSADKGPVVSRGDLLGFPIATDVCDVEDSASEMILAANERSCCWKVSKMLSWAGYENKPAERTY